MVEKTSIKKGSMLLVVTIALAILILQGWEAIIALFIMLLLAATRYTKKTSTLLFFSLIALLISILFEQNIAVPVILSAGLAKSISSLLRLPYQHYLVYTHYLLVNFFIATVAAFFFLPLPTALLTGVSITTITASQRQNTEVGNYIIELIGIFVLALVIQGTA